MLDHLPLLYFSPTNGTRNTLRAMAAMLASASSETDLSSPSPRYADYTDTDLVLVGMPVFGGRIPSVAVDRLLRCSGNNALAISVVCYGNRAYEDALLELNNTLEQAGFTVIASAALITPHSIDASFGTNRPDAADTRKITFFCHDILNKLADGNHVIPFAPGNIPYKEYSMAPVVPAPLQDCTQCGHCASVCPTQAINSESFLVDMPDRCIRCMRCVHACPEKARAFPKAFMDKVHEMLTAKASGRQEPEFFI